MVSYIDYQGQSNVVCVVYWNLNGEDGGYMASHAGDTSLTYQSGSPFTPYDELTEDQVIGWVKTSLGEDQIKTIEAELQTQLDDLINPPVVLLPLPWSQT